MIVQRGTREPKGPIKSIMIFLDTMSQGGHQVRKTLIQILQF